MPVKRATTPEPPPPVLSEEQVLLTKADATALLHACDRIVHRVIRCTPDSILYLGIKDRPMTAWLQREPDDSLVVYVEPGFPATPMTGGTTSIPRKEAA